MSAPLWQLHAVAAPLTQTAVVHDTATTVTVKNPVPGFIGRIFQWGFNIPQWMQWSAILLGCAVGVVIALVLWRRRQSILLWLNNRSRAYKIGLVAVAGVMLIGAGGFGYATNHYMQHNNDFCIGCHVMGDAWTAFQRSEHRKLQCHDCHQQSIFASAKQLYFWVAERPQEIPKHAKVPTNICSGCHIRSNADSNWKRISATAGHRLHFNSDSSALKNVQCVTCHGQEVHRFKPVDKTCGQTGCHAAKDTKIVLGTMAGQTAQHCTGCHTFTKPVPENISMDSTRKYLMATGSPESCFGCHEMRNKLKGFEPQLDKGHNGVCGTCHNPHTQTEPKMAFQTCATGGCHSDLATRSPFHAEKSVHAKATCAQCHRPHEWKPVGKECIDCHKSVFNQKSQKSSDAGPSPGGGLHGSPAPAATSGAALLKPISSVQVRVASRHGTSVSGNRGRRAMTDIRARAIRSHVRDAVQPRSLVFNVRQQGTTIAPRQAPTSAKNSAEFSHRIHKVLACAGCHDQKGASGRVNVRTPSDCAGCHHSPERSVSCTGCHSATELQGKTFTRAVPMRTASGQAPRTRNLPFMHRNHRDLECKGCHTNGILLGVTRDCQSCHTDHHVAERTCTTCHVPAKSVHQRASHDGCAGSGCHTNAEVLKLAPARQVCLACHADQVNHKPKRECSDCHAVTWGPSTGAPR